MHPRPITRFDRRGRRFGAAGSWSHRPAVVFLVACAAAVGSLLPASAGGADEAGTGGSTGVASGCVPGVLYVAQPGATLNGTVLAQPAGCTYSSIQAAVDAASPGDTVLIAPGDYKTTSYEQPTVDGTVVGPPAGVLVTTPGLHLVGMDRNTVIVDGTRSGPPCSTAASDQNFGPIEDGGPAGLNGIMVWKAPDVWVDNLTVCNFLGGTGGDGGTGNEVWWNGGAGSGQVFTGPDGGQAGYWGDYLTTTSTYYGGEQSAAAYGIFSSNWDGGTWDVGYASNFNDSGYYIGACQQQCNQTVDHAWSEFNALGYSGSNSGGTLVVKNSTFDQNEDGFDTNSQNGDNPPPQDGACPDGGTSPITHTHSCWVFMDNRLIDNNNPNVPSAGFAGNGPVGTGMSLSGARDDTVTGNLFEGNDAWGTLLVPFPDSGQPCSGGLQLQVLCWFTEYGDAVVGNTYVHNGSFGNPTNGDIGAVNVVPGPTDCFSGNVDPSGLTTSPPLAEVLYPSCTGAVGLPDLNLLLLDEVACDSQASIGGLSGGQLCLPGSNYPRRTAVVMHPLPGASAGTWDGQPVPAIENPSSTTLATMADPCRDVPSAQQANPWCAAAGSSGA